MGQMINRDKEIIMETELIEDLKSRYKLFMEDLDIGENGLLGKISNPRYKDQKLRFSGFPYVGSKYSVAKKKILFVGQDIGKDECREDDSYHDLDSRRISIAGSVNGCISLDYNDHISGTYVMVLFLLREYYSWEEAWNKLSSIYDITSKTAINRFKSILPIDVLDYVALTNIHKFVSLCRGCDPNNNKPKCWNQKCIEQNKIKNRSGSNNRKWYNKQEEIDMFLDEIHIFKPDLVYFQGSSAKLNSSILNKINSFCDICISYHPSAWNVGANKPNFANKIKIKPKTSN